MDAGSGDDLAMWFVALHGPHNDLHVVSHALSSEWAMDDFDRLGRTKDKTISG